jgi:hypothetical protein
MPTTINVKDAAGSIVAIEKPLTTGRKAASLSRPVVLSDEDATSLASVGTPQTTGGLSIFRSIDLDQGTLEVVKASAGQIYGMWVTNTATATRYIKIYNATSGTAGTGTPVITIGIPGNSTDAVAGLFSSTHGIAFSTGNNEVIVNVFYK